MLAKKVTIPTKHLDFANIFLKKLANVFLKQTKVNKYAIELEHGKQLPYKSIYILGQVELETLKTYIKNNLANGFIKASKLLIDATILFLCKCNGSFCLCAHY